MRDLNLNAIHCPNPVLWQALEVEQANANLCSCSCSYTSPVKNISTPENPPMLIEKIKKTFMRNSIDYKSCKKRLF